MTIHGLTIGAAGVSKEASKAKILEQSRKYGAQIAEKII
jgi:hypothetical protein